MKILLVLNKTLNRNNISKFDSGYFNVYIPLLELGHEVYFYDTVKPNETNFQKIVDTFKPDFIFCCLTGDRKIAPFEPFEELKNITEKGLIKTFNWFCDDTWRFQTFSKYACKYFFACSTPEANYIEKFKQIGYNNIILGQWHCNENLYVQNDKRNNIGFCGGLTQSRYDFLKNLERQVNYCNYASYEDMISFYSSCRISLNFTINDNDVEKKRQMKLRIFEVTNANSLLLTENVDNLHLYFEPNKEVICFENQLECRDLIDFYLKNPSEAAKISEAGRQRFLKEHTSKKRLKTVLDQVQKL